MNTNNDNLDEELEFEYDEFREWCHRLTMVPLMYDDWLTEKADYHFHGAMAASELISHEAKRKGKLLP